MIINYEDLEKSKLLAGKSIINDEVEDKVNSPKHYKLKIKDTDIEVMDIIEAVLTPEEFRGYKKGNVLKYILRERNKNGLEDLKKCENYLNRLINGE